MTTKHKKFEHIKYIFSKCIGERTKISHKFLNRMVTYAMTRKHDINDIEHVLRYYYNIQTTYWSREYFGLEDKDETVYIDLNR